MTAVVVTYNSEQHIRECLDALLSDTRHLSRVYVVDNASSDASADIAAAASARDARVNVVTSDVNLGLAGAVNLILESVETPFLAVLNPDVTPREDWLSPMVRLFDSDPGTIAVCPLILMTADGRVNSAGQHVHVTGLGFNRMLGRPAEAVPPEETPVGGIHGAAFAVRTRFLTDIGGWDDTGFLYHEDVALSWDILLSGGQIKVAPESRVSHDYHLTMYPDKFYLLERNRWALLLSHLTARRMLAISPMLSITEIMTWGLALFRGPRFLFAKSRSVRWIWANRKAIRSWRIRVRSRPEYDTANLRRHTRWGYPGDQLRQLASERGESTRVPEGGLPV